MPPAAHAIHAAFVFVLGTCVGSFLNVVVWRLPRVEHQPGDGLLAQFRRSLGALSDPPSHCPKCEHAIRWYDNLPVVGWIKLGGRCRDCKTPISPRYPVIEAVTGLLFLGVYLLSYVAQDGILASPMVHWGQLLIVLVMAGALLAASLIDAELFIIPAEICWTIAAVGLAGHAVFDREGVPGSLLSGPAASGLAAGAGLGLLISLAMLRAGVLKVSFPSGEPMEEQDRIEYANEVAQARKLGKSLPEAPPAYTRGAISREIRKEMQFLIPPLLLGGAAAAMVTFGPLREWWESAHSMPLLHGLLGSLLGACVGAFVVWFFRIVGTLALGRVAMGLGDVHLMFAIGAVIGAGPVTVVFFLAPFAGLVVGLARLIGGGRHELPYGPYLALATAVVLVIYPAVAAYLSPGLRAMAMMLARNVYGG